jgi:hypothetical protein
MVRIVHVPEYFSLCHIVMLLLSYKTPFHVSNDIKYTELSQDTVKPVLRGHLWDKVKMFF